MDDYRDLTGTYSRARLGGDDRSGGVAVLRHLLREVLPALATDGLMRLQRIVIDDRATNPTRRRRASRIG